MYLSGKYRLVISTSECQFPVDTTFDTIQSAIDWFDNNYERKGFSIRVEANNHRDYYMGQVVRVIKSTFK